MFHLKLHSDTLLITQIKRVESRDCKQKVANLLTRVIFGWTELTECSMVRKI